MLALPKWADNAAARALLDAIIAATPETRICDAMGFKVETFSARTPSGKLVARLRRMRREWVEREMHLLDRQFEATHHWDDEASRAVFGCEDADALVRRLLSGKTAETPKAEAA